MPSPAPFCPKTGRLHSEYPSSFSFCPECCLSLQGQITSASIQGRPEPIVIEDSPQPAKSALFVPSASTQSHRTKPPPYNSWLKAQHRIAAAEARQQSIQRTAQGKPRTGILSKEKEFAVIVSIYIIPTWYENEGFGMRFKDSPPYHKAQLLIPGNRTITSTNDFLENCLLNEIERLGALQAQGLPMKLATDFSKEGPTYLTKRAEQFRTVKELLESGLFRKDSRTGNISIVVVIEKEEEEIVKESLSADELACTKDDKGKSKVKRGPKIKRELKLKQEPKIKQEWKVKQEVFTPVRKRGFSKVSPETPVIDEDVYEEGENPSPLTEFYDLRSRQ